MSIIEIAAALIIIVSAIALIVFAIILLIIHRGLKAERRERMQKGGHGHGI